MSKRPNFEKIFKTLVKQYIEEQNIIKSRALGIPTGVTESGKFTQITQKTIDLIKPK